MSRFNRRNPRPQFKQGPSSRILPPNTQRHIEHSKKERIRKQYFALRTNVVQAGLVSIASAGSSAYLYFSLVAHGALPTVAILVGGSSAYFGYQAVSCAREARAIAKSNPDVRRLPKPAPHTEKSIAIARSTRRICRIGSSASAALTGLFTKVLSGAMADSRAADIPQKLETMLTTTSGISVGMFGVFTSTLGFHARKITNNFPELRRGSQTITEEENIPALRAQRTRYLRGGAASAAVAASGVAVACASYSSSPEAFFGGLAVSSVAAGYSAAAFNETSILARQYPELAPDFFDHEDPSGNIPRARAQRRGHRIAAGTGAVLTTAGVGISGLLASSVSTTEAGPEMLGASIVGTAIVGSYTRMHAHASRALTRRYPELSPAS